MVAEAEECDDESLREIDCPVLVTERLVLRKPHETDAADLASLANNPRIAAMLTRMPHPYGLAEAHQFLDLAAARRSGCVYSVTLAATGQFIGCAGLENSRGNGLEIGYWIGQPFWGKGYATEAAQALVDVAFRNTTIDVLRASCRVVQCRLAPRHPQMRFPVCRPGHHHQHRRRPGDRRALPPRPGNMGGLAFMDAARLIHFQAMFRRA